MTVEVIYFVRHGETDLNREFRCQGRQDISLNESGREQIEETAKIFEKIHTDSIFSSPLPRAVESARIIADRKGLPVRLQEWLVEINHGGMEGLNPEESEKKYPGLLKKWHAEPDEVSFPGGESIADVAERVTAGLSKLLEEESGTVMLVTHQVISGVAKAILDGGRFSDIWQDKLVNGGYFRFDMTSERTARVKKWKKP